MTTRVISVCIAAAAAAAVCATLARQDSATRASEGGYRPQSTLPAYVDHRPEKSETAVFAAGCFWGVEAAFRRVPGVVSTRVGYCGGTVKDPDYRQVCTGSTGHAESVEVVFDPAKVSYGRLLQVFWDCHDPTTPNRQGPDVGTQYRSVIFCQSPAQERLAKQSRQRLDASGKLGAPIVTQIVPAAPFYPAEEYHQQYLEKRGLSSCHL